MSEYLTENDLDDIVEASLVEDDVDDEGMGFVGEYDDEPDEPESLDAEFNILDPIGIGNVLGNLVGGRRRRTVRPAKPRNYYGRVRGISGGTIRTPAGTARIKLPRHVVTTAEFKKTAATIKRDIKRNASSISTLSRQLRTDVARLTKQFQDAQQMSMMMGLLSDNPKISKIKLGAVEDGYTTVSDVKYKDDDNDLLMLMMMSGSSGGMFGASSTQNPMMMYLMIKALDKEGNDD